MRELASPLRFPSREQAPPGRSQAMRVAARHAVLDAPLAPPFPDGMSTALFGMGCFWGVERMFWQTEGVYSTAVGYAAGQTPNPSYEEVCTGLTGHNEVVQVVFDPARTRYAAMLHLFWERHDPTQGMRQGNDRGTQYRSGLYFCDESQREQAEASRDRYQKVLEAASRDRITTEILPAPVFYYAEDYHQQYLAKVPDGYCAMRGSGVPYPS